MTRMSFLAAATHFFYDTFTSLHTTKEEEVICPQEDDDDVPLPRRSFCSDMWMLCLWMSFWILFCSVLPVSLVKENSENQNLGYQQQLITVCATGFEMWTFSFVCFLPDDCLSVYCGPNNNLSGFCVNIDLPAYCREKKKGMTILFSFPLIIFYFFFLRLFLPNRFPLLVFSLIFLLFLFPRWRPRGPIL